jgi:hypothetical protein
MTPLKHSTNIDVGSPNDWSAVWFFAAIGVLLLLCFLIPGFADSLIGPLPPG